MHKPTTSALILIMTLLCTIINPVGAQTDQTPREILQKFESAYESGQWERAAQLAEQLAETDAGAQIGAYNAACAHALAGNPDAAAEWLLIAAERGFSGVRSLEEEADLESIRDHPDFKIAYESVVANSNKRFEDFKEAARETDVLTIEPDGFSLSKPTAMLIVLHGSAGTPEPLAEIYKEIADEMGLLLVVPSALRPWGNGFGWTYRDESEWLVLDLIERFKNSHNIDPDRVYLAGFSQGANVTLAVGLKHPSKFAGLFPVCGHYEPDVMPISQDDQRPPIYLMIGSRDPFMQTFRDAYQVMKDAGFPTRLRVMQGVGHAYPGNPNKELRKGFMYLMNQ